MRRVRCGHERALPAGRSTAGGDELSARFLVFWLLLIGLAPAAHPAAVEPYDEVVDVTGLSGAAACASIQGALNDVLGGKTSSKRVLVRGQLGTPTDPVDFSMFHNAGEQGAGGRPWPYSVCHAFWTPANAMPGEGIVDGYPDPLLGGVLREGAATGDSTRSTVAFREKLCHNFSIDRKLAVVRSGRGKGQIRRVAGCESDSVARVEPEWDEPPDASSIVSIVVHRVMNFGQIDLYVEYDLDVHYRNDERQGRWQHGVFADMGLACYFIGDYMPGDQGAGCPATILDGIHRSGRITVHEYGRRDDDRECAPTWLDDRHLTNRPYSIVWQAYGQGVHRGSDSVRLDVVGQGDRDNVGVAAAQTWTKDFRGWRIKQIGTGLWLGGSLNDTLYDPYITGNEFGVVIGANESWGAGSPRSSRCYTGFCAPFQPDGVIFNFRGGVVEGNRCGNFVMFGGYGGEVDRTFVETANPGAPTYAGHSVIVGAGVCDASSGESERQGRDRSGQVCADDLDCPGECVVDPDARRLFAFQWNAALVSNRGSSDWFSFALGKGTRAEYLHWGKSKVQNVRVMGGGLGGEYGHPGLGPGGQGGVYFFASEGASVLMDVDEASGTRRVDRLPPYDYYVSMPALDFQQTIERPGVARHLLGVFPRRATCTGGRVSLVGGDGSASLTWTIKVGPVSGGQGERREVDLLGRARVARRSGSPDHFSSADLARPYVPRGATAWLEITDARGGPDAVHAHLRCYEDKW